MLTNKTDYLVHQGSIDYGGDAGGYIIKEKLFFYGGFNPLTSHDYKEADPIYANHALGVVDRKATTYDYTAKLNYNLGSKHQFEGSVFGDPSHTPMQFNAAVSTVLAPAAVDTTVQSKLDYGTRTWTARYTGALTSHWVATVNYSNYYNSFTETPKANGYSITDNTPVQDGSGGSISYGGLGFIEGSESKVNQLAVSSSHIFEFFGGHNVTLGYQFEETSTTTSKSTRALLSRCRTCLNLGKLRARRYTEQNLLVPTKAVIRPSRSCWNSPGVIIRVQRSLRKPVINRAISRTPGASAA